MSKIKLLITAIFFVGGLLTAYAFYKEDVSTPGQDIVKQEKEVQKITYDTTLVSRFTKVCQWLDTEREECLVKARLDYVNNADTSEKAINFSYTYSKRGQESYYAYDRYEQITLTDYQIVVDHPQKRVYVSSQQNESNMQNMKKASASSGVYQLIKECKKEGYRMQKSLKDDLETISLINPNNISCRRIDVTFDTIALKPVKLVLRVPNPEYFSDQRKDKILSISIDDLDNQSKIDRYLNKSFTATRQGVKVSGELKDYTLINL